MEPIILYAALLLLIAYVFLRRTHKEGKTIPGPKGLPILGYFLQLRNGIPHQHFVKLREKYGDIFQINALGKCFIVLSDAKMIRMALGSHPYNKAMNDRHASFYGEHVQFGSQSIALMKQAYGSPQMDLRKAFRKGLHVYGDGRRVFEEKVHEELSRVVARVEGFQGQQFDMVALMRRSLTNLMSIILGGHDLKDDDNDLNMFWDFDQSFDYLVNAECDTLLRTVPFLIKIPGLIYKKVFDANMRARDKILRRFFHEKKATFQAGTVRGLVDFMIGEQLEAKKEGVDVLFTDERIIAITLETIAAGILTTLSTLSSIFFCLVNHPEYQTRIQEELDRIVGQGDTPTFADRQDCVITEAVIMEAQRYNTVVPLIGHMCNTDIQFQGYHLPANATIIPNLWHVHHDEDVWGDPWSFRPERWIADTGDLLPNDHPLRASWMPFGTGRRQCVGENLARSRIFLYVATLLQRWTLEMVPGHAVSCDPRLGHYDVDITSRPKPFMCRAVPRQQ